MFIFLPVVLLVYFLLNKFRYIQTGKIWMILASLYFYGYWNPDYLFLILISILLNFGIGNALHKTKKNDSQSNHSRKFVLIAGIVINLSILGYFKYTDFLITNANLLFEAELPLLNLLLPLAISFFTFQQIAYLVDCYRFDTQEYNFLNYCLFVTFFPQLIAGPIVHHKEMMPQFSKLKNAYFNYNNLAKGLFIFSIGLFKKVVIADSFAIWANQGFASSTALSFFDAWGTSLSYTFQLYYDFSGYSDMAIGAALMFNIYLPINFNSPYKALNIQDFWRRWHITLSRWLKDYVYIPLGGNRNSESRTLVNVMATFILGGLWHGAGWTFIIWGALHGLAILVYRLWQTTGVKLAPIISWTLTFLFINFSWVFFRADDIPSAFKIIEGMTGVNGFDTNIQLEHFVQNLWGWIPDPAATDSSQMVASASTFQFIVIFGLIAFYGKNSMELGLNKLHYTIKDSLFISISLFLTVLLGISSKASQFLYFNF